jgi:hypothetical protein
MHYWRGCLSPNHAPQIQPRPLALGEALGVAQAIEYSNRDTAVLDHSHERHAAELLDLDSPFPWLVMHDPYPRLSLGRGRPCCQSLLPAKVNAAASAAGARETFALNPLYRGQRLVAAQMLAVGSLAQPLSREVQFGLKLQSLDRRIEDTRPILLSATVCGRPKITLLNCCIVRLPRTRQAIR